MISISSAEGLSNGSITLMNYAFIIPMVLVHQVWIYPVLASKKEEG